MKRLYRRGFIWLRLTAEYSVVLVLAVVWLYSGKPQFFFDIPFPPTVEETDALGQILYPSAAGMYQTWDMTGAASHWQALSDGTDAAYISTGVDEERDTQAIDNESV